MDFLIIDLETLKEIDPFWETRRTSNDGTKAIIHKEIWDRLTNYAAPMPLYPDEEPAPYPLPIYSGDEINSMPEFTSIEEPIK